MSLILHDGYDDWLIEGGANATANAVIKWEHGTVWGFKAFLRQFGSRQRSFSFIYFFFIIIFPSAWSSSWALHFILSAPSMHAAGWGEKVVPLDDVKEKKEPVTVKYNNNKTKTKNRKKTDCPVLLKRGKEVWNCGSILHYRYSEWVWILVG